MKIKVRVTQIKKGDRFWNEYWGRDVIATTDAYRLDGRESAPHYGNREHAPTVAVMAQDSEGTWHHSWWMVEVGVRSAEKYIDGGLWSEVEHRTIEVEREEEPAA